MALIQRPISGHPRWHLEKLLGSVQPAHKYKVNCEWFSNAFAIFISGIKSRSLEKGLKKKFKDAAEKEGS